MDKMTREELISRIEELEQNFVSAKHEVWELASRLVTAEGTVKRMLSITKSMTNALVGLDDFLSTRGTVEE